MSRTDETKAKASKWELFTASVTNFFAPPPSSTPAPAAALVAPTGSFQQGVAAGSSREAVHAKEAFSLRGTGSAPKKPKAPTDTTSFAGLGRSGGYGTR